MLDINGIPPRLNNQICEALICQQYWYQHKLVQEVDALFIKVNGRWHELYFDNGIVFWRDMPKAPTAFVHQQDDPFEYRLVDIGQQYGVNDCVIRDCAPEPLVDGVRVTLVFEKQGSVLVTHSENRTALLFC